MVEEYDIRAALSPWEKGRIAIAALYLYQHRFRSRHLRAILAIKATGYGSETQRRVQAGCGSQHEAHTGFVQRSLSDG